MRSLQGEGQEANRHQQQHLQHLQDITDHWKEPGARKDGQATLQAN